MVSPLPVVQRGRYMTPTAPGFSVTMKSDAIAAFTFPSGAEWRAIMPPAQPGLKRYGQRIDLKLDQISAYERLHAAVWPQVLAMIHAANMRNYSIFRHGTELFGYFEYVGTDFTADTARIADDPATQSWWKLTDPMQIPMPDRSEGEWWATAKEIFHTD